ncbi:hypothetical protein, conserved [Trypanosoma brucei gambiense DAL972]|uniref:Protein kinase domain-containing protein n=1 Tax=Trypanosoma brucei gambiense (strain MHOM/CI/86/DAL972) TaxID=679716 RepID=C9ZX67_TRYB9|nr:hypothetical protein, conserved [Trypanosoma brucei gambiense DAL972]CBH14011.1 hypothetical protein, conserved [Trypanosoma brucei gambiense DAL972]|eukprot:XP_011776282.1 hypothetical protein, conserved [Trypanosoma brucei gambiense DAL972]
MLTNSKMQRKIGKGPRKQRPRQLPQFSSSFKAQVTFSSSVAEHQQCVSTPVEKEKVCMGNGFFCRIFDEAYAGVEINKRWPQERLPSIVRNVTRQCWSNGSPEKATFARPSHSETLQPSPYANLNLRPPPLHQTNTVGIYASLASEPPVPNEPHAPCGTDYQRNVRRGSRIVRGTLCKNHTACVVRVFVVDGVLLHRLSKLSDTLNGTVVVTNPNSRTDSAAVSPTPQRDRCSGGCDPGSPLRNSGGLQEGGELAFGNLPADFPQLLELQLKEILLSPESTTHCSREGITLASAEANGTGMSSVDTLVKTNKRIGEIGGAEFFVSPQATSRRVGLAVTREMAHDVVASPLSALSMRVSDTASNNSCANVRNQMSVGGGKESVISGARGYSPGGSFSSQPGPTVQYQAGVTTSVDGDIGDFTFSTTIPNEKSGPKESNGLDSNILSGQMPILGLSVFSLGEIKTSVTKEDACPQGPTVKAEPVTRFGNKASKAFSTSLKQKSSVNRALTTNINPSSDTTCKSGISLQAVKKGVTGVRRPSNDSVPRTKDRSKSTSYPSSLDYGKGAVVDRLHTGTTASTFKIGTTGPAHDTTTPSATRGDLPGAPVPQEGKTVPQFAIALSLPLVPQGNVYDVFLNWSITNQPSNVLREVVIRNIIRSVLKQLATLHAMGRAHGSVKATNIFLTSHVMEAVAAANEDGVAPLTPKGCTLTSSITAELGNSGTRRYSSVTVRHTHSRSSSGRSSAVIFDEAATSARASAEVISNSEDNDAMLELSNHVILSDGYYGRVEQALFSTFAKCCNSVDREETVSGPRGYCEQLRGSSCYSSAYPLPLKAVEGFRNSPTMDALHLFTVKEQEYLPPPECIIEENTINSTSNSGCIDSSSHNDPIPTSKLRPSHGDGSNTSKKAAFNTTGPRIRATHNTHNPRCPLTPAHDIWMLGLLAIHLADGACPWWMRLHHRPLPRLRRGRWSLSFASFVQRCVCAAETGRPSAKELLLDKWFDCALLDKRGEEGRQTPTVAASQKPQQTGSGAADISLKRPCHRAFVDIMLEYHELAEEWYSRCQHSNTVNSLSGCGDSIPSLNNNRKEICSLSMMGEKQAQERVGKQTSERHEVASPTRISSRGSSRGSGGSNGRRKRKSGGRGRVGLPKTHPVPMASGEEDERNTDDYYDTQTTGTTGVDESHTTKDGSDSSETEGGSFHSPQPFFIGALSLALEACGYVEPLEAETPQKGTLGGRTCPSSCRQISPPYETESTGNGDCISHSRQHELLSELMQAFWNLNRECRLATDVWCVTLMKHMRQDNRMVECVMPFVTNETLPFFTDAEGTGAKQPGSRDCFVGAANQEVCGGAAANEASANSFNIKGSHVSFSSPQQQPQQKQHPDVSPTAFHNYMLGKWCITTSWVLQQQQQQQQQQPAKRLSGGDEKK